MGEYNFLPMWYRKKMERKEKIKYNMCIIILIFLSLFCIIRYFINGSHIENVENSIQKNIYIIEENHRKKKLLDRDKYTAIDTFINLKNTIDKSYSIEDIYISQKDTVLEGCFKDSHELIKFIEDLEQRGMYKIKKLDLDKIDENNIIFKIGLGVNNYDKEH